MVSTSTPQTPADSPQRPDYALPTPADGRSDAAIAWLWLGVLALLGAGIFSILLVISRAPFIGEIFPLVDLFQTSLIIHVDLSVLVWFLAFGGVLWALAGRRLPPFVTWPIFALAVAGTVVIVASPLFGAGDKSIGAPLIVNYIPVLNHPIFFVGLLLFGGGVTLHVLATTTWPRGDALNSGAGVLQ